MPAHEHQTGSQTGGKPADDADRQDEGTPQKAQAASDPPVGDLPVGNPLTGDSSSGPPGQLSGMYDELRSLAARYLNRQRPDHTLQPTALVHEVYMRLVKGRHADGIGGADLMRLAASAMRSVLVDHARRKGARKRKRPGQRVPLEAGRVDDSEDAVDMIALDDALHRLAELEPQWSTIIEMRFFGGCTEEEIAELLDMSTRTVRRQWRMARAWLRHEIEGGENNDGGGSESG